MQSEMQGATHAGLGCRGIKHFAASAALKCSQVKQVEGPIAATLAGPAQHMLTAALQWIACVVTYKHMAARRRAACLHHQGRPAASEYGGNERAAHRGD